MRRTWIRLFIGAIVLLMAAPAAAKRPDNPGHGGHPAGLTCAEFADEYGMDYLAEPVPTENGFRLTLTPEAHSACVDLHDVEAAIWAVDASLESALRYNMSVKDSVPEDFCFFYSGNDLLVPMGLMPSASLDACGDEYSDSDDALVFQASAKVKKGGTVTLGVTLSPAG